MNPNEIMNDLPSRVGRAVAHYWETRATQRDKQKQTGKADQGLRSAVTGGAQMEGFIDLFTELIAAFRRGRNSIGVEIDPEYCRMAARYLKAENANLFSTSKLIFERAASEPASLVEEDRALYEVRPARKRLE